MKLFKNMDKGILTDSDMKQPKYRILYGCMFLFLIIDMLVVMVPVIWILLSGFKDVGEMYQIPTKFFPKHFDITKLFEVWKELKFYKYYASTFIMAGGCVAADIIVCGLAGYSLSKIKPAGTKIIIMLMFWLMLLPGSMRTVPLYMEFKSFPVFEFSMLNTFWPMWLMAASNIFDIILFKNFFDGISTSLVEAARVDGASDLKIFGKIMVPLSLPIFMTVGVLTFNSNIGQFLWPYITITDERLTVIGVAIYKIKNSNITMDRQMLSFLFAIIPQVVIFIVFQKYIMGGINVGGVKE